MDYNDTTVHNAAATQRPWQQQLQQMLRTLFESPPRQPLVRQQTPSKPCKPLKKQPRALLKNLEELYEEEPPKLSLKDQLKCLRVIKELQEELWEMLRPGTCWPGLDWKKENPPMGGTRIPNRTAGGAKGTPGPTGDPPTRRPC